MRCFPHLGHGLEALRTWGNCWDIAGAIAVSAISGQYTMHNTKYTSHDVKDALQQQVIHPSHIGYASRCTALQSNQIFIVRDVDVGFRSCTLVVFLCLGLTNLGLGLDEGLGLSAM